MSQFCPTCKGLGKARIKGSMETCLDCDGKGLITDEMYKFIRYYYHQKAIKKELELIEKGELETVHENE